MTAPRVIHSPEDGRVVAVLHTEPARCVWCGRAATRSVAIGAGRVVCVTPCQGELDASLDEFERWRARAER